MMNASPELFDGQAGLFERRAGLPEACCRAIAKKVIEIGEATEVILGSKLVEGFDIDQDTRPDADLDD